MYKKYFKRVLDILLSLLLIILLFPIMIIIGCISKVYFGKSIYKQYRVGKDKKSFVIYKFQTMLDIEGNYETRTPKVMRKIRNWGLDELPQLFNIVKGDMSFIGPRPFIVNEILPEKPADIVYTVRPGVISLAVANGRRKIAHHARLKYDYKYIENISFKLDLLILLKTIQMLFKQNLRGEL